MILRWATPEHTPPTSAPATDLDVTRIGSGAPVVLVHGSVVGAERTWRHQLPLAEHWSLCLPNRPGFGASPPLARGDFEREAPLIAELLGDGAHLVGHSYGAVIALYAAALRPGAVRSLTVSEPGCLRLAAGDPRVDAAIAGGELLYAGAGRSRRFSSCRPFAAAWAPRTRRPRGYRRAAPRRPSADARTPAVGGRAAAGALRAAPFPKLVISGGHSPVFEAVCDVLQAELRAPARDDQRARAHDPGRRCRLQRAPA